MSRENRRESRRVNPAMVRKSAEERNSKGGATYLKLPPNVSFLKIEKEGIKKLDILAYEVPKNTLQTKAEPGDLWYELTYWTHKDLGADGNVTVVCPKMMLGEPCPLCEKAATKKARGDEWEDFKDLLPKRRQMFIVIDNKKPDDIQIMDTSYPKSGAYKSIGNLLDFRLANMEEDDARLNFSSATDGMMLEVGFSEDSFNKNKFFKPISVDFIKRKEQYEDSFIDELPVLDDILVIEDYATIEKLMYAESDLDNEGEEKPAGRGRHVETEVEEKEEPKSRRTPPPDEPPVEEKESGRGRGRRAPEPEGPEVEEKEKVEEAPRGRRSSAPVEKEETQSVEEAPRGRGRRSEPEVEEKEKVEEAPRGRRSAEPEKPAPAKAEEAPRGRRTPPPEEKGDSEEECPAGFKFGEADEHKECDKCKKWEACDVLWQKLDKERKAAKK